MPIAFTSRDDFERALSAIGDVLQRRGVTFACVVAGGAALSAIDRMSRVTSDIDVLGVRLDSGQIVLAPSPLPSGFDQRIQWRSFAALEVGFLHREDLIALKLDAATDGAPRQTKHFADLQLLQPTPNELVRAAAWVRAVNVAVDLDDRIDWVIAHVAR